MKKHIVCLTFDFDGISGFVARGASTPTPVSRGEFGPRVGAPRLLALMQKFRIKSSWYVPGHTIETFPDAVKRVVDHGHEIGHHGWKHVSPVALSRAEEEAELTRGNEAIRRISGEYARGWIAENKAGRPWFNKVRESEQNQLIEKVGSDLRALMPVVSSP